MSRKNILYLALGAIVLSGAVVLFASNVRQSAPIASATEEQEVRSAVLEFGERMKNVSLLSPQAAQDIRTQYEGIVSEEIIAVWEQTPSNAPGRRTSGLWPERIDILEVIKQEDGAYDVQGTVIEMTSGGPVTEGSASQYAVALRLRNRDGAWVITGYQAIAPVQQ